MSKEQYEAAVERLKNEVAVWRGGQSRPGGRLPERFWSSATALVAHSSIEKVATATGLSAEGLKKRSTGTGPAAPSFVELLLPPASSVQCIIKVESATGARMQCEIGNLDASGLATVIREFTR
jgi:hypothetical protein